MTAQATIPQLSIIIPHLNEPDNLRRCLQSLEQQRADGVSFEIIVADNGSARLPSVVCADFPEVRLIVEQTPGPGPARNSGAVVARAGLIAFIDADCVAELGWVRNLVGYFTDHPEVDFVGGAIGVLPAGQRLTAVEAFDAIFSYRTAMLVQRQRFAPSGNLAMRKSCFIAVGPFAGIARHEDRVWGHKAVGLGMRLDYVPAARVLTEGCDSFAALARRTDIQLAHDRADIASGITAQGRWLLRAAAVALSPFLQWPHILRSADVRSPGARWAALRCLVAIRAYRARRMVGLIFNDWSVTQLQSWNRTEPPTST